MAGSKSNYLEDKMNDHVLGGPDYTRPATVYFAFFTAAPGDGTPGTEVNNAVWTNYARVAVTNNNTNFPASSGGVKSNGTTVSFGVASITGTPPIIVGFAIMDASTSGNMLYWSSFTGQTVNNGSPVAIDNGSLVITED